MSSLRPTLLFLLTFPSLIPLTSATQPAAQTPLALPAALSHLSSLFTNPPTPTAPPACCNPTCPPQACNIHASPLATDLAYLFPLPTTTPPVAASKLAFPCCAATCPDGACRASPAVPSERPSATASVPPPGDRLRPGFGGDDGDESSIIIGCCKKCVGCRQSAGPDRGTATERAFARATGTETPPGAGVEGDGEGGEGGADGPGGGKPPQPPPGFVQPPLQPGHPHAPEICIGCVGGVCFPCVPRAVATLVGFTPDVGEPPQETSTSTTGKGDVEGGEEPEPTMILAADYADAVKGKNQDVVPVVVQSFGEDGEEGEGDAKKKKGEWELMTLLASVDLKVQDNYISRRVVKALGLGDKVQGFKKGTGKLAVLTGLLEPVVVEGYLDLQIVIGSRSATTEGDQWQLLRGVRWYVHGQEEGGLLASPDVVLGTRVLGEVGGLSLVEGVRRQVQGGVKVLGVGHFVEPTEPREAKESAKDEL